ncbi:hypothetical protein HKT18_05595 [Flavobacterium sp. IMCC34852]|uniref:ABC-three component systems C-terminal domain-containing protein n=1 Tax=Flavobacterium rivulicola TaxID=2732161 RepID=A0A7Y3VYM3_9FLAO|nr:ABC-three component system protein [Flavobacterium sp. IMCC34852]NNT71687.1 hypothetical protein [Flavobacterium sp. IMCC34852]
MGKKVKFSSPAPTGAIISQFYLALEKCFDMDKNESIYIEKDGDVSLINRIDKENGIQTELKEYSEKDNLTDSHLNFWNTLNNWLSSNFDSKKYKFLILATTQEIGNNSYLQKWNTSSKNERLEILNNILTDAENRYKKAFTKDDKAGIPESLKLMRLVFSNDDKLLDIIDKVYIDSSVLKRNELIVKLKNVKLKSFDEENRESVLNSLLGYIIQSEEYNKGWEISYDNFSQELIDLNNKYKINSVLFPYDKELTIIPESKKKEFVEYDFIKKIKEINYESVIPRSLNHYWFTFNTINNEFKTRTQRVESLLQFQDELIDEYSSVYDRMSRNCNDLEIESKSQDFFDIIMEKEIINIDIFNNTPLIFKKGMYHILADEKDEIIWKLKNKSNE